MHLDTFLCVHDVIIAGANIFLSSNGSIKVGDFGLSVQLKNYNMTMPNEIKQQAGTVRESNHT